MQVLPVVLFSIYSSFFGFAIAELRQNSLCDPEGTLREFTTFEKIIHGASYEKCVCNAGYHGRYCERIFRCISGRPFAINCTDPPRAFESSTKARCGVTEKREIDVCLCFIGYQGNRCEKTVKPIPMRIGAIRISSVDKNSEESQEAEEHGKLAISSPDFEKIDENEEESSMEKRFWYLAFCLALAGVLAVLLIGLYFLILQKIYKDGLKHLTVRELRNRIRGGKLDEEADSLSLPPSYEDVQQQQKFLRRVEEQPRPSVSNTIETTVSIENIDNNQQNSPQPQYKSLYVHV